jgi:hypothetical protein
VTWIDVKGLASIHRALKSSASGGEIEQTFIDRPEGSDDRMFASETLGGTRA